MYLQIGPTVMSSFSNPLVQGLITSVTWLRVQRLSTALYDLVVPPTKPQSQR